MKTNNKVPDIMNGGSDSERGYKDAFLALKEPEQPITIDQAKKIIEQKEEREI